MATDGAEANGAHGVNGVNGVDGAHSAAHGGASLLDMRVTDGGANLSAGLRQLLMLARALLKVGLHPNASLRVADALVGFRVGFHNVGLSALWMSEVSRVLVDTVARFETEFVRARHSLHFAFAAI